MVEKQDAPACDDASGAAPGKTNKLVLLEPRHPPPAAVLNRSGAVEVSAVAHVMSVQGIDSKEQQFHAHVWLQVRPRTWSPLLSTLCSTAA
jgi:hypothetical protein